MDFVTDIWERVVARVDHDFSARATDPFNVHFNKGIYSQVNAELSGSSNFPLVWFVIPYTIDRSNVKIFGRFTGQLIIVHTTKESYTQQQREDEVYKKRLFPIYEVLLQEIKRERAFSFSGSVAPHRYTMRPYWGKGDVNGPSNDNFFKRTVDMLIVSDLNVPILNQTDYGCRPGDYSLLDTEQYQLLAAAPRYLESETGQ